VNTGNSCTLSYLTVLFKHKFVTVCMCEILGLRRVILSACLLTALSTERIAGYYYTRHTVAAVAMSS
jgi:hypothetical protein